MSELIKSTTVNGFELDHPREIMDAMEFKKMAQEWGFIGGTPAERVQNLKDMDPDRVALFLGDINRRLQGSDETLVADHTIKIGGKETISPEDRGDLFLKLLDNIKSASEDTNPARIGDTLGLGVVVLHPFEDGNGRTARSLALLFRDDYDSADYKNAYDFLTQSKEEKIKSGGVAPIGYIPYYPEGMSGDNPQDVASYFDLLTSSSQQGLYMSPAGGMQAPLKLNDEALITQQ